MRDCGDCGDNKNCGPVNIKKPEEPATHRARNDYHGKGGTLWLVSTRICNFACAYCYQGADHSWKKWQKDAGLVRVISDEVLERTLSFAQDYARNTYGQSDADRGRKGLDFYINWYGGEPLLTWPLIKKWTPRFYEELGVAGRKIKVGVTTNGSLLNEEKRKFLDEYKMGILFSLDGPPWRQNKTRVLAGGKPSWDEIEVKEIISWRPGIEIAWQLTPGNVPEPSDLDYMRDLGFQNINFNINWLVEWPFEDQQRLTKFMYYAMRLAVQTKRNELKHPFRSNWFSRIEKLVKQGGDREAKPCGTGLGMVAVTPEGWLYPSQEMAFSVFEPNKAPGTAEYYKVGDLFQEPIINEDRLEDIFNLYNDDMIPPPGYDCTTCPVRSVSFGGCHCRYVGENNDPASRHHVALGWCQGTIAGATGGLQAFAREGYLGITQNKSEKVIPFDTAGLPQRPTSIVDLDRKLDKVLNILEK